MDYDRYDAFLHHIFKQTQGDAWFRPNEDNIAVGVALRVDSGEYRVFPYENLGLEPFEAAVRVLNPAVAVKVRSAAVHAAFSDVCVSYLQLACPRGTEDADLSAAAVRKTSPST